LKSNVVNYGKIILFARYCELDMMVHNTVIYDNISYGRYGSLSVG